MFNIYSAPAETVLTLDVALTVWAMVKFSTNLSSACPSQDSAAITCKFYPSFWQSGLFSSVLGPNCDDMSEWVTAAGQAYFRGLGDFDSLTSHGVLQIFKQRMDMMSWGLAERFKHVLIYLEREEVARIAS